MPVCTAFVKTKSTNTVLMLSAHVVFRPADQIVPSASAPVDDQYNLECFSMVNLLEGLSDGMRKQHACLESLASDTIN